MVNDNVDATAAWANNAPANTAVTIDYVRATGKRNLYEMTVYNPSTETLLTCRIFKLKENVASSSRYSYFTEFSCPNATSLGTITKRIEGLFDNCNSIRLIFTNDAPVGVAGAFTATVRLEGISMQQG